MREYLDDFVIIYLNNILIYSDNLKSHYKHVYKILGLRRLFLHAVQAGNLRGLLLSELIESPIEMWLSQCKGPQWRRAGVADAPCSVASTEHGIAIKPPSNHWLSNELKTTPKRGGCEAYAMLRPHGGRDRDITRVKTLQYWENPATPHSKPPQTAATAAKHSATSLRSYQWSITTTFPHISLLQITTEWIATSIMEAPTHRGLLLDPQQSHKTLSKNNNTPPQVLGDSRCIRTA